MRLTRNTHNKTRYDYIIKKITARFYEELSSARRDFVKTLIGIKDPREKEIYSLIIIYRLISLSFILSMPPFNEGPAYLLKKFNEYENEINLNNIINNKNSSGKNKVKIAAHKSFYLNFLKILFFKSRDLTPEFPDKFFHENITEKKNQDINVNDHAIKKLIVLLNNYKWKLDDSLLENENEINLEVLGYIFERYCDQKESGVYYTKEETSLYVCENTLIPALLIKLEKACAGRISLAEIIKTAFTKDPIIFFNAQTSKDFFKPAPKPVEKALQTGSFIKILNSRPAGDDNRHKKSWNEIINCRRRVNYAIKNINNILYEAAKLNYKNEEYHIKLNSAFTLFITANINLSKLFTAIIDSINDIKTLSIFYESLLKFRILDGAAGSGSFLFAVIKVLKPIYKTLFNKLNVANHDNNVSICDLIVSNNLYAVDIMPEALITLKTRLALKLTAERKNSITSITFNNIFNIIRGDFLLDNFIKSGIFDVVICNPPYVPVKSKSLKTETVIRLYGDITPSCSDPNKFKATDIFPYYILKCLKKGTADCVYGFITPLSACYGINSKILNGALAPGRQNWIAAFDNIPSPLFAGISQRICFWLAGPDGRKQGDYYSTPLLRWRSKNSRELMNEIFYTRTLYSAGSKEKAVIIRINDEQQLELIRKIDGFINDYTIAARKKYPAGYYKIGYSHVARNFISAYLNPPPCFNSISAEPENITRNAGVCVKDNYKYAVLAALNSETFYFYWLARSDGFNVSYSLINDFIGFISHAPEHLIDLLGRIGEFIHQRRFEALTFKKNAGKFIGNFNCRQKLPELCRRADLLIIMSLSLGIDHYRTLFNYIQNIDGLNNNQKSNDGICAGILKNYKPLNYNLIELKSLMDRIDSTICNYFNITQSDINYICSQYHRK